MRLLVAALGALLVSPGRVIAQDDSPTAPTFSDTIWNCSGWHTVVANEGCWDIEQKYNITLAQFLSWNPSVSSDCATNFWPDEAYCVRVGAPGPTLPNIAANCDKWHTVVTNEGCWDIEQAYNITLAQFLSWNPDVSSDCGTNFWPDYSYCVGVDANVSPSGSSGTASATKTSSVTSSSIVSATSSSTIVTTLTPYSTRYPVTSWNLTAAYTATASPPQHTFAGQPGNCNRWHWVVMGDSCDSIVNLYGNRLTEAQLLEWNPSIGSDCSGLYYGWYACIGVQATTSISIGWSTAQTGGNASIPASTAYVPAPATVVANFTASPTATGMPTGCQNVYMAEDGDTCNTVLEEYNYISRDQFFAWNPSLNNNCNGLLRGVYYCVANFGATTGLMPPTVTASATPTATGTTGQCSAWYLTVDEDDCSSIALSFGTFSESDFISWNPSVSSDCSGIQTSVYYCVAVPSTPATRTAPLPSTPAGLLPTQTGVASNCTRFQIVSPDDTCDSIISGAGIAASDFYSWNPAIGGSNCSDLAVNYYVCVSTSPITDAPTSTVTLPADGSIPSSTGSAVVSTTGVVSTTAQAGTSSTTPSSTSTGTGSPIATPSPIMPGMVAGCERFYYRGPDGANLYCYDIAAAAGISLTDFTTWNPGVGSDCSSLWADTWYCIGLTGPATAISTGTPAPAATGSS